MNDSLRQIDLGFSPADAESVELLYQFGDLLVRYKDGREIEQEKKFHDVLAFKWQAFDDDAPRNDVSYEVQNSQWLKSQAKVQEVPPEGYVHYRICFNENGVLDVLALSFATVS